MTVTPIVSGAVAVVIALLCWRAVPLQPQPGLDPSWQAGLHMALHEGVQFGRHLIFTYGPLGFLSAPTLWYSDTGTVAFFYEVLVRVLLAAALFAAARRSYGAVGGALVAYVVAAASGTTLETVPFLILCVWLLGRDGTRRGQPWLLALAGAIAGFEALDKTSIGIEMGVLALVAAIASAGERRRNLPAVVAAFAAAALAAWTATGQSWGQLPAYAHDSARIVSGYAAAMGLEGQGVGWEYVAGWVVFGVGLAGALAMTELWPARRRWGVVALWGAFCFFEYKEGFVRHEVDHGSFFFIAAMGGFLAFRWPAGRRLTALGLTAALVGFAAAAQNMSFATLIDPDGDAGALVEQVEAVVSPSQSRAITASGRADLRRAYPIDPATLALLRGHTVAVFPYANAIVWAYGLSWRPLPVLQSYSAYTTGLDELDAVALSTAQAPERILRNLDPDIDNRFLTFDQPLATRAMLCRYQELRTTQVWQVLAPGPDRCTAPRLLKTVTAPAGTPVSVPAPPDERSFVYVRIGGVAVGGLESLTALLYKPQERQIQLGGSTYRLVEGTAEDGLLLRAPGDIDFTAPFALAPNAPTVAAMAHGGGGEMVTYTFYAESVSVGPRYAPAG